MSDQWQNWDDNQWNTNTNIPQGYSQPQQRQQHNNQYSGGGGGSADYYQQSTNQYSQPQSQQAYGDYYSQNQQQPQQPTPFNQYGFQSAQQFMSEPMFTAATQFGGQFAEQQKEKLTKYLSAFNLKYYFAVDNLYVGKKLGILLFPFFHQDWTLKYSGSQDPVPAKDDVNAPDLYIPLMAFITYILVSGFVLGTQGRFSPEMLGILTSNAFIWVIIENIIIFVSKYVMNISQSLSVWHSLAYSTYKFVGMIFCLLMFMAGGKTFYYCALGYTALTLVFFLLRTVKNFVFDANFGGDDGRKRKLMLILFILVSQPLIMWWLTSGSTSYEYGKLDFAQLAMSKMGMAADGGGRGKGVPMTADGDIDYEALLAMPKGEGEELHRKMPPKDY